jgi:branched-subunit amino acid transport protein
MSYSQTELWLIILAIAFGTYVLRFSFLGIIGDRELPAWVGRHLRYVGVAVMPAIVAPLVLRPRAPNGETDPARIAAAFVAFGIAVWTKSVVGTVFGGLSTLYIVMWLLG